MRRWAMDPGRLLNYLAWRTRTQPRTQVGVGFLTNSWAIRIEIRLALRPICMRLHPRQVVQQPASVAAPTQPNQSF
jgi:hypothetical protein